MMTKMSHGEVEFLETKWFIREAISGELLATVEVADLLSSLLKATEQLSELLQSHREALAEWRESNFFRSASRKPIEH